MDSATLNASALMVNGMPANTVALSQNNTRLTFHYNSSPVTNQGLQTMHIAAGAFLRAGDHSPVVQFSCPFYYDETPLAVASTDPPVGGTFAGPGPRSYDVNWNEAVNPNSVQTTDLQLTGVPAIVQNVQVINGNTTLRFTINFLSNLSGTLEARIPATAADSKPAVFRLGSLMATITRRWSQTCRRTAALLRHSWAATRKPVIFAARPDSLPWGTAPCISSSQYPLITAR